MIPRRTPEATSRRWILIPFGWIEGTTFRLTSKLMWEAMFSWELSKMNEWANEWAELANEGWLKSHLSLGVDLFPIMREIEKFWKIICPQLTNVSCNDYLSHYRWRFRPERGATTEFGRFRGPEWKKLEICLMRQSDWMLPFERKTNVMQKMRNWTMSVGGRWERKKKRRPFGLYKYRVNDANMARWWSTLRLSYKLWLSKGTVNS